MSVLNVNGFVSYGYRCLAFLFAGKGKVVSGIEPLRLISLEDDLAYSCEECSDATGSQAVSDSLRFLVRKAPANVAFSI